MLKHVEEQSLLLRVSDFGLVIFMCAEAANEDRFQHYGSVNRSGGVRKEACFTATVEGPRFWEEF